MRISDWSSDVCSSDLLSICPGTAVIDYRGSGAVPVRDCGIDQHGGSVQSLRIAVAGTFQVKVRQRCRRSEEHTSELHSLMRISYAVFCLKKKKHLNAIKKTNITSINRQTIKI